MKLKTFVLSLLVLFSISSHAEDETAYAVWCAGNATLYFTSRAETLTAGDSFTPEGSTDAVTITNVWNGTAVTASADTPGWNNTVKNTVTTVVFEPSFANVRPTKTRKWFANFSKLVSIQGFNNLNTSSVTTMYSMFESCTLLPSLDLSTFNTSDVADMQYMFYNCKALANLNLSGFDTGNVTNTYQMFYSCTALTSLNLSGWNTASLTKTSQMFRGCNNLESLNLSGWANTKLTDMSQMFYDCKKLSTLTLTGFATPAATTFNSMFAYCQALVSIDLSGFNTTTVKDMQYMFYGCTGLTTPIMTGWDTSAVTSMYQMFYNCTSLTSLNLSGFSTEALTNTSQMFRGCTNLESLNLSGWANPKLTNLSSMFYDCKKLSTLNLTNFSTSAVTNMESMFQNCQALTNLDLSSFNTSLVTTVKSMFNGCTELTTLNLTNWVNTKVTNFSYMFNECTKLSTLTLTGFETPAATDMSYMFQNCAALTSLDLSGFNTAKVTNMGYMFNGCTTLGTLNLGSFNTTLVTNMSYMFQNCMALTSLDLSSFNTAKVTNMGYMFNGCNNLVDVFVSQTWSTGAVTNSGNMFKDCTSIVGQDGTTYNSSSVDKTRATDEAGGYMKTGTAAPDLDEPLAYAIWCADNTTLYFLNTTKQLVAGRNFTPDGSNTPVRMTNVWNGTYVTATGSSNPQWYNTVRTTVQHVVFEPSFANVAPTSVCAWFRDCVNLVDLTGISNLNTASVTNMSYMFSGCTSLQNLSLAGLNTASVTNMSYMFSGCTSLQNLSLAGLNTASVNNMSYLFNGCSALQGLDLSGLNTANVTNMSYMFQNCASLTTLDLSSFNTAKVGDMKYMFSGCSQLASIYVGSFWAVGYVTNANNHANMFKDCTSIVGQDGTTYNSGSVDKTRAHNGDGGYLRIGTETTGEPEVYVVWCAENTTLYFLKTDKPLIRYGFFKPEGTNTALSITGLWSGTNVSSITSIPGWNSTARGTLTTVVIDDSFAEVRPTSTYAWFADCTKLTSISGLEYLNTSNVTTMREMFSNCSLLENIDVSHFNTANVTNMYKMFYGCSSLQSLNLLGFDINKVTTIESMFQNCSSLTELDLTYFKVKSTMTQHNLFNGCTNLVSVYISSWSSSSGGCNNAFKDCFNIVGEYGVTYDPSKTGFGMLGYVTGYFKDGVIPCVIWCANTGTLYFSDINRNEVPEAGDSFTPENGEAQVITTIWTGSDVKNTGEALPGWNSIADNVQQVTIESSFSRVRATSLHGWFEGFSNITSINGTETLKTSSTTATTMSRMFKDCAALTSLDLAVFKPTKVTDMSEMFSGCAALEAVTVDTDWTTANVTNSTDMFAGCTSIVGQDGTTYDASVVDKTKAHYATGGYLRGVLHPYVVWVSSNSTLYFTAQPSTFDTATTFTPEGGNTTLTITNKWDDIPPDQYHKSAINEGEFNNSNNRNYIYYVVFESSFSVARPVTMWNWFAGCKNLKTVTGLENLNTSKVTSMYGLFSECSSLESIDLSSLDVSNVTNMAYMFSGCFQLKNVNVAGWNTSKVENMAYMFANTRYNNWGITTLDLSSFDTSNVTNMTYMFYNLRGVKTVYVGENWNTDNVGSSSQMFYNCTQIVGQDGTTYDANYVDKTRAHYNAEGYLTLRDTNMPYALWCGEAGTLYFTYGSETYAKGGIFTPTGSDTPLTITELWCDREVIDCINYGNYRSPKWVSVIINNDDGYALNHIVFEPSFVDVRPVALRRWFAMNVSEHKILDINGLEYLNTEEVTDMCGLFEFCTYLPNIDVSHFNTSKVTNMSGMFSGCVLLTSLDVSNFDTSNVTDMSGMFANCKNLTSLDYTGFNTANVTTMVSMFSSCEKLTSIDVSSFNTAKVKDFNRMFEHCKSLESIDLTGINTANALSFNSMFSECSKLTNLDVSGFDTANATDFSFMFYNCKLLQTIDVSGFDTGNAFNLADMFLNCNNVTNLDVSGFNTQNACYMDGMFSGCRSLTNLDVRGFKTDNIESMASMFHNCTNLTSLDVSGFNTENVNYMEYMFSNCSSLTELDVTNFNTENVNFMNGMFSKCDKLHSLDLTSFNTSNVYLMNEMFKGCTQLERIFVSDGWSTASVSSFYYDSQLGEIYDGTKDVFLDSPALIGEDGTTYNSSRVTSSYAHTRTGGYLTSNMLYDTEDNHAKITTLDGKKFSVKLKGRTLYKDGTWNTLCLPFALSATQMETLLDSPEKVMTLGSTTYDTTTGTLTLNFEEATTMEAGKPYIVKWTQAEDYVNDNEHNLYEPTFTSVTLSNTTSDIETDYADFLGTFAPITLPAHDNRKIYLDNNSFHHPDTDVTINAFRGWWLLAEGMEGSNIGDVNGDNDINVTDVTSLVNHILNRTDVNFIIENADVNSDGEITVTDVTTLVNLILSNIHNNNQLNIVFNIGED
ncbi:MAG: BspA family leucine-rich repeat surface protein [Prevotella sp.]|nr:BspA family leucine-rich repeat surface protein [Prevotella sp.]